MASLAFGLIGQAVGSTVGLGSLGFAAGSALGGNLFQNRDIPDQVIEGPRISDARIQNSSYGENIPRVYGQTRLSGNVIWAGDIEERVNRDTQTQSVGKGGLGGGGQTVSQTTITYSYFRSFAVSICQVPVVNIDRIWANSTLIYDIADGNSNTATDEGIPYTEGLEIYREFTDDQASEAARRDPSPIISAVVGADNTPAFRDIAYVVFKNMFLGPFGNQMPTISFEVRGIGADFDNVDFFIELYYLAANPDVRAAVEAGNFTTGQSHFLKFGEAEGRAPYPANYSEAGYLAANPDVAAQVPGAFATGLEHYVQFGYNEMVAGIRTPYPVGVPIYTP